MGFKHIGVEQARSLMETGNALVIDIRDKASYDAGHIPGAEAVNDSNVEAFVQRADRKRPLIVCCYHGNMSQGAADYFSRQGFENAYSLDGGYEAWRTSPHNK